MAMINDDGDDRYAQATTCLIILMVINNDDDGDGDDYYDRYAQATTSGKLGLRVCGFQRYSQTDGAFQKVTTTNPTIIKIMITFVNLTTIAGGQVHWQKGGRREVSSAS